MSLHFTTAIRNGGEHVTVVARISGPNGVEILRPVGQVAEGAWRLLTGSFLRAAITPPKPKKTSAPAVPLFPMEEVVAPLASPRVLMRHQIFGGGMGGTPRYTENPREKRTDVFSWRTYHGRGRCWKKHRRTQYRPTEVRGTF